MSRYSFRSPLTEPLIFDSHAHYDDQKFDEIRDELLAGLPLHGVRGVITCACDGKSSRSAIALAEKYDYIYCTVGIHPENLGSGTEISEIEELSKHKKCVAIGEIGLDYYWISGNREQQMDIFEKQLILANRLDMPVIVHDREAHADTLELLLKHRPKGVVHSFSGSPVIARDILSIGMYLGVGGVVTFKNAKRLPEVMAEIPEDRFVLETDAPYLTPVPFRSEINDSSMIYFVAQKIAEIRNCTVEKILNQAFLNSQKLFGI